MGNQQGSLNQPDWMNIPGLPGYFSDAMGNIVSLRIPTKVKRLSLVSHAARGKKRYVRVKANGTTHLVHRLVASAIVGRPLDPREMVNHKNGNTMDNHPSNLEVVSHRDNVRHAVQNGLYCSGEEWYAARGMLKS